MRMKEKGENKKELKNSDNNMVSGIRDSHSAFLVTSKKTFPKIESNKL